MNWPLIPDSEIAAMWIEMYEEEMSLRKELERIGFKIEINGSEHTTTHNEIEQDAVNKLLNSDLDEGSK